MKKQIKKWSAAEERELIDMYNAGMRSKAIGELLERTDRSIDHKLNRLRLEGLIDIRSVVKQKMVEQIEHTLATDKKLQKELDDQFYSAAGESLLHRIWRNIKHWFA
jgi:uncharacterized hydantoinase/oxoprolinase family protein